MNRSWSASRALCWEYARIAGIQVAGAVAASCALAALFHHALEPLGARRDRLAFVGLLTMLLIVNVTTLMNCREGGMGLRFEGRLYRLPIATWKLVAGRFFPALVAAAVMVTAVGLFMRFGIGAWWPLLGPLLVTLASLAWTLTLGWSLGRNLLAFVPSALVSAILLGAWLAPRLRDPRPLANLASGEMALLGALIGIAFPVAVLGVARDRATVGVGDDRSDRRLGISRIDPAASAAQQAAAGAVLAPVGSAFWAQAWMEWREKGWLLPLWAVGGVIAQLALRLITGAEAGETVRALMVYPLTAVLLVPPAVGFMFGRFYMSSDMPGLDPFRARRPLSDTRLAWTFLLAGALTMVITIAITAGAVWAAIIGLSGWTGKPVLESAEFGIGAAPSTEAALYIVLAAAGYGWSAMGVTLGLAITGRNWVAGGLAAGPYALIGLAAVADRVFASDSLAWVIQGIVGALVVAVPLSTVALALSALRSGLMSAVPLVGLLVVWSAVSGLALMRAPGMSGAVFDQASPGMDRILALALPALLAMPFLPVVLVPVALRWNRHR